MPQSINAIIATDLKGNIGFRGTLPWKNNSEDMKWFSNNTKGHIVIMGRKTWDDPKIPKPLPERINVVVTSTIINTSGVITVTFDNLEKKIKTLKSEFPNKNIFIIGGKRLFESCQHLYDQIYWTQFKTIVSKSDTSIDINAALNGFYQKFVSPKETCTIMVYKRRELSKQWLGDPVI